MPRYRNVYRLRVLHSKHAQAASPPCRRATLAGRTVREIRHPELIGSIGLELPIDMVQRARGSHIRYCRTNHLATLDSLNAKTAHQSLDRAARHFVLLAMQSESTRDSDRRSAVKGKGGSGLVNIG